jgi:predicted CXXCH cytochrome family protein
MSCFAPNHNTPGTVCKTFLLLLMLLIFGLYDCTPAYRHKALVFFFDGVPGASDSTEIAVDSSGIHDSLIAQNITRQIKPTLNFHSPFKDKQCNSCHDQGKMGSLIKPQPKLCYECHEDFGTQYKVLHGPVGGGQCTMCHNPHSSSNKYLLTRSEQSMCLFCHKSGLVMHNEIHREIGDASCTECHNPHGGNSRSLLN